MTEQELTRRAKRRLAILRHAEEITGNVSLTCRYYGISRQCFYTWKRRYDTHGLDEPYLSRLTAALAHARPHAELVIVSAHVGPNWGGPSPAMQGYGTDGDG